MTKIIIVRNAVFMVLGVVLNRDNVVFTGMTEAAGASYFPSAAELFRSLGLISGGILIYLFIVENFDVFPVHDQHGDQPSASPALKPWPCFSLSRLPTGYIRSIV
jgi:Ni/Fe-hydrogenase subunit HybB-like protein